MRSQLLGESAGAENWKHFLPKDEIPGGPWKDTEGDDGTCTYTGRDDDAGTVTGEGEKEPISPFISD